MTTHPNAFRHATTASLVALAMVTGLTVAHAAGQSLNLRAGLTTLYDDNILQYSDAQLQAFDPTLNPARFAIETPGDAVFHPSLALGWEIDRGHGRRHALGLRTEGDYHGRDGTADFHSIGADWRESFQHERRLSLGYYFLPNYYLRQLYDEDWTAVPAAVRYHPAQFDLHIASAGWSERAGRDRRLDLAYQFERRSYDADFRERDSDTHQGTVRFGWRRLPRGSQIDLWSGLRMSHAAGNDGDDTLGVVPDDADISYHGVLGGAGGRMDLAKAGAWSFLGDLSYQIETRSFVSDRTADRYHFGRHDLLNAVEVGVRGVHASRWSLRAFYRFENNAATLGSSAPPSSDVGSYRENQVGLAITWSSELWRQMEPNESVEQPEP